MDERAIARFWAKVERRGADECWLWTAHVDRNGYGKMWLRGTMVKAPRMSFHIATGRWPEPMCLHLCDNPRCVNPAHLAVVTRRANFARRFTDRAA